MSTLAEIKENIKIQEQELNQMLFRIKDLHGKLDNKTISSLERTELSGLTVKHQLQSTLLNQQKGQIELLEVQAELEILMIKQAKIIDEGYSAEKEPEMKKLSKEIGKLVKKQGVLMNKRIRLI